MKYTREQLKRFSTDIQCIVDLQTWERAFVNTVSDRLTHRQELSKLADLECVLDALQQPVLVDHDG